MIAGRYSLDREIGRGGMGAVWLGIDEVLGRQVALKRIGMLPGAETIDLARAEREARLAAQLNHPHVVSVFDLVVDTEEDVRWLVMEYVEGRTLAQLVRDEGPLTPDETAALLEPVADALVTAHALGMVHRDVKPGNILVDRNRNAKLTDFGIARITADATLTQTGLITGSPAYLAPEVAAGQKGDEAVDVWSLGATAFHTLSGRPPYDMGENVLGGLYRLVNDEPPRLPEAGWLAPMLEGTMVKDPARRWSMAQVRDVLAGAEAPALPPAPIALSDALPDDDATTTQVVRPARRRAWLPMVGVFLVIALAVGLGLVVLANLPGDKPTNNRAEPVEATSPAQQPTAAGMESFIRDYVQAVSTDPETAFQMLTPKFQEESGGLDTYRDFWSGVGEGEVLSVSADPKTLLVTYQVRFENFGTGERPTVLKLVFEDGDYRIDEERTAGV